MKRQLVATVLATLAKSAWFRDKPGRRSAPMTVTKEVFHVHFDGTHLLCSCVHHGRMVYDGNALDVPPPLQLPVICVHIQILYRQSDSVIDDLFKVNLTELGREMFNWRYAARSL